MSETQTIQTPATTTETTEAPVTQTPSTEPQVETPVEDIVTRAAKFKAAEPETKVEATPSSELSADFDRSKYEAALAKLKSTDPELASQIEAIPKSWQSAYTKKIQELQQGQNKQQWTPQRIQQLVNDPEFLQAAQQVYGQDLSGAQPNEAEDDYLSDEEKQLRQQLNYVHQQLSQMQTQQLDTQLQQRFPNYDTSKVNDLQQGLITGRVQATREHLWKALDYEDAVNRAYQMGREDSKSGITRSKQAASPNGHSATTEYTPPARGNNESRFSHLQRMIAARMEQKRSGGPVQL